MSRSAESDYSVAKEPEQSENSFGVDMSDRALLQPLPEDNRAASGLDAKGSGNSELERMLSGFSLSGRNPEQPLAGGIAPLDSAGTENPGVRGQAAEAAKAAGDSAKAKAGSEKSAEGCENGDCQSLGDKLSGVISKIGQFLESVLPPEYAQYVRQYLPMAEQYISGLLNDVKLGQGENGAKRLEANLHQPHSVQVEGGQLDVEQNVGFDVNWTGDGVSVGNISGMRFNGEEVQSGRVEIGGGSPTLYATVKGANGELKEISIPLPDVSSLMGLLSKRRR